MCSQSCLWRLLLHVVGAGATLLVKGEILHALEASRLYGRKTINCSSPITLSPKELGNEVSLGNGRWGAASETRSQATLSEKDWRHLRRSIPEIRISRDHQMLPETIK